jgi:putative transposase
MLFAVSWAFITGRNRTREAHPGSRSSPHEGQFVELRFVHLFRCESATLRTHWVLVVMDQFTRRMVGFGVQGGIFDGPVLCRMFNRAIRGQTTPKYVSTDNDPWYRFHQWQANLRVLEVTEIKTVPDVPLSHPFVERLTGTLRRECLDRTLF